MITKHCTICGQPLSPIEAHRGRTCFKGTCLSAAQRAQPTGSAATACKVCGRPIPLAARRPHGTCGHEECLTEIRVQAVKGFREKLKAQRNENIERVADDVAVQLGQPRDSVVAVTLPANTRGLTPLPEARKVAMTAYIGQLVEAAFANDAPLGPVRPPDLEASPAWFVAACAACSGFCCLNGKEYKSYLTVDTMRRHRESRPELTREEMVAAYTRHFPDDSVDESCVFHGVRGCTLPREIRSETCNAHFCTTFKNAHVKLAKFSVTTVVAGAYEYDDTVPVRTYLMDEKGIQPLANQSPE